MRGYSSINFVPLPIDEVKECFAFNKAALPFIVCIPELSVFWEVLKPIPSSSAMISKSLALKEDEIAKIKKVLHEVEFALSQAENKLASANDEHSKTIEVLMETQVEYHELKTKSWMSPLLCFL